MYALDKLKILNLLSKWREDYCTNFASKSASINVNDFVLFAIDELLREPEE